MLHLAEISLFLLAAATFLGLPFTTLFVSSTLYVSTTKQMVGILTYGCFLLRDMSGRNVWACFFCEERRPLNRKER